MYEANLITLSKNEHSPWDIRGEVREFLRGGKGCFITSFEVNILRGLWHFFMQHIVGWPQWLKMESWCSKNVCAKIRLQTRCPSIPKSMTDVPTFLLPIQLRPSDAADWLQQRPVKDNHQEFCFILQPVLMNLSLDLCTWYTGDLILSDRNWQKPNWLRMESYLEHC